jgi:Tol biopolymer transport system component
VGYPAVSLQGRRLAYERPAFDSNIWVHPLPGAGEDKPPRPVVASTYADQEPRISPRGDRIAFSSNRTGHFEIWVSDPDGSNLTQLTSLRSWAGSPRWSHDGRRIAFDSSHGGNWDIFVVDAQGGAPRQLTSDQGRDARPSWSRDGRWIYFTSNRSGAAQIWKKPTDGGEAVQVTQGGGYQPFESADGHNVYFRKVPSFSEMWSVPVEGGEETAVRAASNAAAFAVGPNGLYFVEYREISAVSSKWFLRLLRSDAAEPIDVMEVPPPWWASALDISPDGSWLVYTQSEQAGSDLMMLENFE